MLAGRPFVPAVRAAGRVCARGAHARAQIAVSPTAGGAWRALHSPYTPLGRAGQPTELAPAYVFLASPESSYVVGATIPVTGGMPTP